MKKAHFSSVLFVSLLVLALLAGTAALAAPPNLMAAFFVKGKVGLKWSMVDGVNEYLVFRKLPGAEYVQIDTVTDDHYFDSAVVDGATYLYKIAIVENGAQVFSGEKSVTTPKATGDFAAPTWSGVRVEDKRVMLNWDKVPGAIAYNVWRSEVAGGPYDLIGNCQTNRYADNQNLAQGVTYYYTVSALNEEFSETPQSPEQVAKFGITAAEREALATKASKIVLEPVSVSEAFLITQNFEGRPLEQPADLAINAAGDIYVVDTLHGAIVCYDSKGGPKFSFGRLAVDKTSPRDGEFLLPLCAAIDTKGEVYVGDVARNDIQVFAADGHYLRTIKVAVTGEQEALRPNGLSVLADGRIVLTDAGNHRWLLVSASGEIILERGTRGADEGQFNFPDQVLVSRKGIVWVVDAINCRIQRFDLEGKFLGTFGEIGQGPGQFGRPKGIGEDETGRIWVSDGMSNLLQCFTAGGEIKAVLGGAEADLRFSSPRGIKFYDGKMLVVERLRNRVTAFNIDHR